MATDDLKTLLKRHEAFWTGEGSLSIHLCGDASRHFPILHDELGVSVFDTGFPIDLHEMRRRLGLDVLFQGGPPAELLRAGPVADRVNTFRVVSYKKPVIIVGAAGGCVAVTTCRDHARCQNNQFNVSARMIGSVDKKAPNFSAR